MCYQRSRQIKLHSVKNNIYLLLSCYFYFFYYCIIVYCFVGFLDTKTLMDLFEILLEMERSQPQEFIVDMLNIPIKYKIKYEEI